MALNQLVDKVRAMHPGAYDDMDDATLTKAVLAKYPQYSDLAAPAAAGPHVNMQEHDLIGPVDQASFSGRTGARIQNNLDPSKMADAISEVIKEFPGAMKGPHTIEDLKNNFRKALAQYKDPANIAGDVVTGMVTGAGAGRPEPGAPRPQVPTGPGAVSSLLSKVPTGVANDVLGAFSPRAAHAARVLERIKSAVAKAEPQAVPGPIPMAADGTPWGKEILGPPPVYPGAPLPDHPGVFPGAPLPAMPAPEQLNPSLVSKARTLPGQIAPESIRPPAQPIPARQGLQLTGEVPAKPPQPVAATPTPVRSEGLPRTLRGDSALTQILTGQDNANLLKIAKSRGINVSKEALLKPGTADNLLVKKIINDFSADELQEIEAQHLENSRFRHNFGDIGPEAWKTLSLQTYFPEMKIPAAMLKRTQSAIEGAIQRKAAAPGGDDLKTLLEQSVAEAKKKRAASQ